MDTESSLISSFSLGHILGIEVKITHLLLILIAILTVADLLNRGIASALWILLTYIFLIAFVFLHEMGHAIAAIKEGVMVRAIYLHPLGGIAQLSGNLPGPGSEIMVALAGPFVSLLLAALFFIPMLVMGSPQDNSLLYYFFQLNLILALFNLLPIFPLDGGRVLVAALIIKTGFGKAVELSAKISKFGIILLGIFAIILIFTQQSSGIILLLIAIMLYLMGSQEIQAQRYAASYTGKASWLTNYPDNSFSSAAKSSSQPKQNWFSQQLNNFKARKQQQQQQKDAHIRTQVDEVLRKVNEKGIMYLTPEERDLLNKASRNLRKKN